MKKISLLALLVVLLTTYSCGDRQTPLQKEYDYWLAKHDSSHQYHSKVMERHKNMVAVHDELKNVLGQEENPDTSLVNQMAKHEDFYRQHEEIMKTHSAIMKDHVAFKIRYDKGEVSDEELRTKLDAMIKDHDKMDRDHQYVQEETTRIRSEHNDLRRKYNEILGQRR